MQKEDNEIPLTVEPTGNPKDARRGQIRPRERLKTSSASSPPKSEFKGPGPKKSESL